ncbi:hypothetical protein [Liberiplasma polymorphum]|uniref:hypothetical protein n=1 Tax=Liberiplasma polymorphum TaxID=3374570 RepID=UPI003772C16B
MEYQCKVIINEKIEPVTNIFLNHDLMLKWEQGLLRYEKIKENPLTFHLIFKSDGHEFVMKETIKDNYLPKSVTIIYEVPGVYNECKNTFISDGETVEWIMDVRFEFNQKPFQSKEDFICKTQSGMLQFKNFIENQQY